VLVNLLEHGIKFFPKVFELVYSDVDCVDTLCCFLAPSKCDRRLYRFFFIRLCCILLRAALPLPPVCLPLERTTR
jgi:hypothetical protein